MEVIVTAKDVSEIFDTLIRGTQSRESLEEWARVRMAANDARDLRFDPPKDEGRLWRAITYLSGVGLRSAPGSYLHSTDDFGTTPEETSHEWACEISSRRGRSLDRSYSSSRPGRLCDGSEWKGGLSPT